MHVLHLICIFLLGLCHQSVAQDGESMVHSIEFTGDHKMDVNFLLDRITTKNKHHTNWEKLQVDKQRLIRLNGVQNAEISIDTLADKSLDIVFDVSGQATILPQFGLGIIEDSFWWQVGGAEFNLFGKNQTLLGFYQSQDNRPNGKLFYGNPNFRGSNFGFSIDAFYNASLEPLFFESGAANYEYSLLGLGVGGILHLGFLDKLNYTLTVFNEDFIRDPEAQQGLEGPAALSQLKILNSLGYVHDKVDFDFFYRKGSQHQVLLQSVITPEDDTHFLSAGYETRHYWRPSTKTNVAAQLKVAIGTNNDSPFAPFVLDSNFNLRGVGNRVDRATAQVVINLEIRQTVVDHKNFAVQMVVFSDSGSWRTPGANLNILTKTENFRSFIGGGTRLILTKVFDSVVRIDYGFDVFNAEIRGLVVGFGQFF